jgi:hypothetical protein
MEKYPPYQSIFSRISYGESQMLDKAFYEEEVKRLCLSFEQQVFIYLFASYVIALQESSLHAMTVVLLEIQNRSPFIVLSSDTFCMGLVVPLRCFLRLHQAPRAGDQEPDVDL